MRFPSVHYLLPFIATPSLPTTTNVVSPSCSLPSPAVVLLRQLTSDPILAHFPARTVSSTPPLLDTAILPRSLASSLLDSPTTAPAPSDGTSQIKDASSSPSNVCQGLIEDLDITGLGVRITFYVTSILSVINAWVPGSDAIGSSRVTLFTFYALMVSAVAQAANRSISLYNVIIVFYLCFLHFLSTSVLPMMPAGRQRGSERRRFSFGYSVKDFPGPTVKHFLISAVKVLFGSPAKAFFGKSSAAKVFIGAVANEIFSLPHLSWHIFGLYVWVHASSFGSQPECNSATKLIVFGRELSATSSGRVISLIFFSINATWFLSVPVITSQCVIILVSTFVTMFCPPNTMPIIHFRSDKSEGHFTAYGRIWISSITFTLSFVIQWIYVVVTIEQTIQQNPVIRDGPRFPVSFGQIFPVVTIGASILAICDDVQEYRQKLRDDRSNKPEASMASLKDDHKSLEPDGGTGDEPARPETLV